MEIRHATSSDLDALDRIERACFPPTEAATRESLEARLRGYPECFWVGEIDGAVVSFVNGMATNLPDLMDEMYEDASMHEANGRWQMIFGVDTLPEYRGRGYAGACIERAIEDSRSRGRIGMVLTCKARLVPYYARFGFIDEGVSTSTHGNAVWRQMRLTF